MENKILPGTIYGWKPEDTFELTGTEFSSLFNTFERVVNNPLYTEEVAKAHATLAIGNAYELLRSKLNTAIENGIAKPMEPPTEEPISNNIPFPQPVEVFDEE